MIELLPHAKSQLLERKISLREVEKTLKKADQVVEGSSKGIKIAQKIIKKGKKNFLYRVVFKEEKETQLIITVYRTTKIKKYFKGGRHES